MSAPEPGGTGPRTRMAERPNGVERIAVLVIDDRTLFGESLAAAINANTPDIVVTHRTSAQALASLPAGLRDTDVVLVSIGQANLTRGPAVRTLGRLLTEHQHPPIAVLADRTGPSVVKAAMRLELRGIVSSAAPLSTVVGALRRIHQGATVVPDRS